MRCLLIALSLVLPCAGQEAEIRLEPVVSGFRGPTDIQNAGDGSGRIFIAQQDGQVCLVRNGVLESTPFLDIRSRTHVDKEAGLLGLAFAPGYGNHGRFYVDYIDSSGDTVVAMYRVSSNPD